MALSKDRLVIEGDAAGALREYAKLLDANKALKAEMQQLRRAAKEVHGEQSAGMSQVGKEILGMVAGYASLTTAVGLVKDAVAGLGREQAKNAEEARRQLRTSMDALAGLGRLEGAPETMRQLEGMVAPGVGGDQRWATYAAVAGAAPMISDARLLAVTGEALKSRGAGFRPEEVGGLAGVLAQAYPGMAPKRAAGLALLAQQAAGRAGEKLDTAGMKAMYQWAQSGLGTPEEGLGYLIATLQTGQKPAILGRALAAAMEDADLGRKGGPTGRALASFAALPKGRARWEALAADPEVARAVLGDQAAAWGPPRWR
jgi:hypothetical protein